MRGLMLMTPGPITNPDLDPGYFDFHKKVCDDLKTLFHTGNDTLLLNGEGILGLEASCASLIEPGDRVLLLIMESSGTVLETSLKCMVLKSFIIRRIMINQFLPKHLRLF